MKNRDRFLTGILLLLIGVLIGTIISLNQEEPRQIHSTVEVTEVKRDSDTPLSDSVLARADPRFRLKEVVNHVRPAVVYIEAMVDGRERRISSKERDQSDGNIWDKLFPERQIRTVGSGVIISSNGYILTNNHVIQGAVDQGIQVTLYDKRSYEADVVGTDPSTDLAVIKIPPANLPAVTIGNSDNIQVGEWVLAIGNPFRLRSTVTAGIVSALHRNVQIIDMDNELRVESFIQTDAAINKGNSGGALVDAQGRLIGINTAIASQSGNYQGYGFAVPANLAIKVAKDLIEYGEVRRAFLGISMQPIDYERSRQLGLDKVYGVEIIEIMNESAASLAGLEEHDVILAIGEQEIREPNELQQKVAEHRPGDSVSLTIWRQGEKIVKSVVLKSVDETAEFLAKNRNSGGSDGSYSDPTPNQFQSYEFGLEVMSLATPEDPNQDELVITEVYRGSKAWRIGLRRGGVIERVDGHKIEDMRDFERRLQHSLEEDGAVTLYVELENHTAQNYILKRESDF